jgi:hypothetical protein
MKTVETKREEIQKKETLRETRLSDAAKGEPATEVPLTNGTNGTKEEHEDDAAKSDDELPHKIATTIKDTLKNIFGEGSTTEEEHAEPKPKLADATNPKEWEHLNVSCDLCKVSPIVGARYKCAEYAFLHYQFHLLMVGYSEACPNFDLCQACFDKREHDQRHQMTVFCTPAETAHDQECSTCKTDPIIGTLYACAEYVRFPTIFAYILLTVTNRDDCTLPFSCSTCFAKVQHNPKHPIVMLRQEEEETTDRPVHAGIFCDYCEMNPIVGTRYKYAYLYFCIAGY